MLNTASLELLMTQAWEIATGLHAFEREYDALGGADGLDDAMFEGKHYTRADFVAACQFAAGVTALVVVKPGQTKAEQTAATARAAVLVKVKR